MKPATFFVYLAAILLLGALFRFPALGYNSFVADEFLDINSAYGYHQTGEWRAWDFNQGAPSLVNENTARDGRAFVYKWQVAKLFSFLPPTEAVARTVSVLWGLLSILVIAWSTWVFTRRFDMSLVAALLTAISVSAIIYSRRLRMYAMFFPLYLAAATAWYSAYETEYRGKLPVVKGLFNRYRIHMGYLALALVFSALAFLAHQLAVHLALALGAYIAFRAWTTRQELAFVRNRYQLSLALGVALALVLVGTHLEWLRYLPTRFEDHVGYIAHAFRDFATLPVGILLAGFGLWYLSARAQRETASLYLALSIVVPLGMAIFLWLRNVGAQYIYFLQSFILIAAAVGVVGLFDLLRERFGIATQRGLVLLALVFFALVPNWGYFFEENNTYHETSTGDNPNYRKVFGYFKKEKRAGDVLVTRNFRNYYWSGAGVPVVDFGGELSTVKFSLAELETVEREATGTVWFVASGNDFDYVAKEVRQALEEHYEQVSNDQVRGDIVVYRLTK